MKRVFIPLGDERRSSPSPPGKGGSEDLDKASHVRPQDTAIHNAGLNQFVKDLKQASGGRSTAYPAQRR